MNLIHRLSIRGKAVGDSITLPMIAGVKLLAKETPEPKAALVRQPTNHHNYL